MRLLAGQRPVWLLLASVLIFGLTLVGRLAWDQPASSTAGIEPGIPKKRTTLDTVISLQDRLRLDPDDTEAYTQLGLALLQRVRENGDASLYRQAEQALAEALTRDPRQFEALIGQGLLALARHHFDEALAWGEKAKAVNPHSVSVYGVIGDAQLELGQYQAAAATISTMMATRPEQSSYSRLSYLRELNGDVEGAVAAMQQAVDSGLLTAEGTLWAQVQLGHLYFNRGDLDRAEQTYLKALTFNPDYVYAAAGLARVQAGRGHYDRAIETYETIVEVLPLPEFVIALGDLYEVTGQPRKAQQQYALVEAMIQLNAEAGMNVDLELALFKADHALDPARTVTQARRAYASRPGIYGADVLAWALYQTGAYREAYHYSQEALRLGTQDALLHYHAGMIAYALGYEAEAGRYLEQALRINPYFSARYGPQARELLAKLKQN